MSSLSFIRTFCDVYKTFFTGLPTIDIFDRYVCITRTYCARFSPAGGGGVVFLRYILYGMYYGRTLWVIRKSLVLLRTFQGRPMNNLIGLKCQKASCFLVLIQTVNRVVKLMAIGKCLSILYQEKNKSARYTMRGKVHITFLLH